MKNYGPLWLILLIFLIVILNLNHTNAIFAQSSPQHLNDSLTIDDHVKNQVYSQEHSYSLGTKLPLWSVIPLFGILLSIAIFPLVAPHFWHHHFGKVSAFWALLFAIPFVLAYRADALHEILHIYIADYIPFIILLWSLFTAAGGILVCGSLVGTPVANLIVLLIGTFLASWIGTTGAAMVLVRPVISMNKYRRSKVHIFIFFTFLVANVGGSLTPLGDPPLFLGFLHHVPFFWTFNLFPHMAFLASILLGLFFLSIPFCFGEKIGIRSNT